MNEAKVPIPLEPCKRSFLLEAQRRSHRSHLLKQHIWDYLFLPKFQFAAALWSLVLILYFVFAATSVPLRQTVQNGRHANGLSSWLNAYRIHQSFSVYFPAGSELALIDGTAIRCLEPSSVSFDYAPHARRIGLSEGKIEIEAAHDPHTPMIVSVDGTEIRVVGTRFVVTAETTAK